MSVYLLRRVERGYNDIGLYDASPITSDTLGTG